MNNCNKVIRSDFALLCFLLRLYFKIRFYLNLKPYFIENKLSSEIKLIYSTLLPYSKHKLLVTNVAEVLNRNFVILIVFALLLLNCTRNIEPMPSGVSVSPSYSFPVGIAEIKSTTNFLTFGLPTVNLTDDVPDWARYEFAFYADTIAFNIQEIYSQAEMIEYFMIRTNVWNSYPMRCFAQIYFLDGGYTVIDSLYNPRAEIPAATVIDGVVSNRLESFRVDLTKERIELLANSQYVVIYSGLEVTEEAITSENASYFNLYGLRIQVAARVDFVYSSK
jgi:hypothetical protein